MARKTHRRIRRGRQNKQQARVRNALRRSPVFEMLEPRILLSASGISSPGMDDGGSTDQPTIMAASSPQMSGAQTTATVNGNTPVLILPGIGGTMWTDGQAEQWYSERGISPDDLQIDPLLGVYDDLIKTYENLGYTQGEDLFVANYDWRMNPAPLPGSDADIDGQVDGLDVSSLLDDEYEYGVDYLGYWLDQAEQAYKSANSGSELPYVNIVAHDAGGLVARSYIQSDLYNDSGNTLPQVNDFVMMGVPNRGSGEAWNPLHNNWNADTTSRIVTSKLVSNAYDWMIDNETDIAGADYNIAYSDYAPDTGSKSFDDFIEEFVPTIRGLLATYDFLDTDASNAQQFEDVNTDPAQRNSLLLDLNDGLDLFYDVSDLDSNYTWTDTTAGRDRSPNDWVSDLLGNATVIYGDQLDTGAYAQERIGPDGTLIVEADEFVGEVPQAGETWYEMIDGNGDAIVPRISSVGQFDQNGNAAADSRFTLHAISGTYSDTAEAPDHTEMVSHDTAIAAVLDGMGISYSQGQIASGNIYDAGRSLCEVINRDILNPRELLADGTVTEDLGSTLDSAVSAVQGTLLEGMSRQVFDQALPFSQDDITEHLDLLTILNDNLFFPIADRVNSGFNGDSASDIVSDWLALDGGMLNTRQYSQATGQTTLIPFSMPHSIEIDADRTFGGFYDPTNPAVQAVFGNVAAGCDQMVFNLAGAIELEVDLPLGMAEMPMPFDANFGDGTTLTGTVRFEFDLTFGYEEEAGKPLEEQTYFEINKAGVAFNAAVNDADFDFDLGLVQGSLDDADLNVDVFAEVGVAEENHRTTVAVWEDLADQSDQTGIFDEYFTFDSGGGASATLPVSLSIGGFSTNGTETINVATVGDWRGNLGTAFNQAGEQLLSSVDNPVFEVSFQNFEELTNLSRLGPDQIVTAFSQLADGLTAAVLDSQAGSGDFSFADAMNFSLPFTNDKTLGELLGFGDALTTKIDNFLTYTTDVVNQTQAPDFDHLTGLIDKLAQMAGVDPNVIQANYDAAANAFTLDFAFEQVFADEEALVDFGLDASVEPFANIRAGAEVLISALVGAEGTIGLDLSDLESVVTAQADGPSNGQLTEDAHLKIWTPQRALVYDVYVRADDTTDNSSLDDLIADLNAAMVAKGLFNVVARRSTDNSSRIELVGRGYRASTLNVSADADDAAVTEMGFAESAVEGVNLLARTFVEDVKLYGEASLSGQDIDAYGQLGFIEVDMDGSSVSADVSASFELADVNTSDGRLFLREIAAGDVIGQAADFQDNVGLTGTANAVLPVQASVLGITPAPDAQVEFDWTDVTDADTLDITTSGLGDLEKFRDMDWSTVVTMIGDVATYLSDELGSYSFMQNDLPLINRSAGEVLDFTADLSEKITAVTDDPNTHLGNMAQKLENALGLPDGSITLQLDSDDVLRFTLNMVNTVSEDVSLDLDLVDLFGSESNLPTEFSGVTDVLGAQGSGVFTLEAFSDLTLDLGVDLGDPLSPTPVLYESTGLELGVKAEGDDIDAGLQLADVLGVYVRDGNLFLGDSSHTDAVYGDEFATLAAGLKDLDGGDYHAFSDLFGMDVGEVFELDFNGQADATLPLFFPSESDPILDENDTPGSNELNLAIADLADIGGTTTFSGPDVSQLADTLDLIDKLQMAVNGLDFLLQQLQSGLDNVVFGTNIPLVGDQLKDSVKFIEDIRQSIIPALQTAAEAPDKSVEFVGDQIFSALGPDGLGLVTDRSDVVGTLDANAGEVLWDISFLDADYDISGDYDFDLGLPALGLDVDFNPLIEMVLDAGLAFGISTADGFFFDVSGQEFTADLNISMPDSNATGRLAFLELVAEDAGTLFSPEIAIDIGDPSGDGRLTWDEFGSDDAAGPTFDATIQGTVDVMLDLSLTFAGNPNFPSMAADFALEWMFDGTDMEGQDPDIRFENVQISAGEFVNNFIGPVVSSIQDIIDPVRPMIDALRAPIPVLGKALQLAGLSDDPVRMIDLARYIPNFEVDGDLIDSFDGFLELVQVIDDIPVIGDDVMIDLGSFDLSGTDKSKLQDSSLLGFLQPSNATEEDAVDQFRNLGGTEDFIDKTQDVSGTGVQFSLPFIENPMSVFEMLLGMGDVELFEFDMGGLDFEFEMYESFPVFPAISVGFGGRVFGGLNLGFGFDTSGLRDFFENDKEDVTDVFNGFYIKDEHTPTGGGAETDIREGYIGGSLVVGASADIGIAEVGVRGGPRFTAEADLRDQDRDGKVHFDEFVRTVEEGLKCTFVLGGVLDGFLEVYAEAGGIEVSHEIASITLVEFGDPEPCFPGRFEGNGGQAIAADLGVVPGVHVTGDGVRDGDTDWYKFDVLREDDLQIDVLFEQFNSDQNIDIEIYNAEGDRLARGRSSDSNERVILEGLESGQYLMKVFGAKQGVEYDVEITPGPESDTDVYYVAYENDQPIGNDNYNNPPSISYYTRADGDDSNDGLTTLTPKKTLQALLDDPNIDLDENSIVLVDGSIYNENITITDRHDGAIIAGAPLPHSDWLELTTEQQLLPNNGTMIVGDGASPALQLDGVSDLLIHGMDLNLSGLAEAPVVQVQNAANDNTFDRNRIYGGAGDDVVGIEIADTSTAPTGTLVMQNVFENSLASSIVIASGGGTTVQNNDFFSGTLNVESTGVADIVENDFDGPELAIELASGASGSVVNNDIESVDTGIHSDTHSVMLEENTISDSQIGLTGSGLLGSNDPAKSNELFDNEWGVVLEQDVSGAIVRYNDIHDNTSGIASLGNGVNEIYGNEIYANNIGIVGGAVIGGTDWSAPNRIHDNTIAGIEAAANAEIRFNRILGNPEGVRAADGLVLHHNIIARNGNYAVLLDNDDNVEVKFNTIYAPTGHGVSLTNNSANIHLNHNIIWTEDGYGITVDLTSQNGFQSDYNNLYRSDNGDIVFWQKAYRDIYNWQVEAGFDLNSIGWTSPDPLLDDPQFVDAANDDYHLTDQSSTSLDAGDPTLDASMEPSPNGSRANLGAYALTSIAAVSSDRWLRMEYPEFHVDWKADEGRDIRWDSHGITGDVRIELVDGVGSVAALIAETAVGDETLNWSPQQSGIIPDNDQPYRIRITAVDTGEIVESRETFVVPDLSSQTYYIDDGSNTNDQYTPGATGDNRNTGASADAPKASLQALLFMYDLGDSDVVKVDDGTYQVVIDMVISGDPQFGNDEGVTISGPTNGGQARFERGTVLPDTEVIDLYDADFTTLENIELVGGERTLRVRNSSTNFTGSYLNLLDSSLDGLVLDGSAENAALDHLLVSGHARHGVVIEEANVQSLTDSTITNNAEIGLQLEDVGDMLIQRNDISGNAIGIDIDNRGSGGTAIIGDTGLANGNGNIIHDNIEFGVEAYENVLIAGNTVFGHTSGTGLELHDVDARRNVVFDNAVGIDANSSDNQIVQNTVYGNTSYGVILRYDSDACENVLYENRIGILGASSSNGFSGNIENNLLYGNTLRGIDIRETDGNVRIINNTIDAFSDADAVYLYPNADDVVLRNNILLAEDGTALNVQPGANVGLDSDFNLFHILGAGSVAMWQGFDLPTLVDWQRTGLQDSTSLAGDPMFVDRGNGDYHLQSTAGSYHGGTLAPVLDGQTNLPVLNAGTLANDTTDSIGIDRGDDALSFANEPAPNGGYVNLGAYGNSMQASQSPSQFLFVVAPDGGEIWPADQTFEILWRSAGLGSTVNLELVDVSEDSVVQTIASGTANDGTYDWLVPETITPATDYAVRVSETTAGVTAESDQPFEITEPINAYYVNLAGDSDFTDNQYTTAAGAASNDGTTAATPMDSIAGLLDAYDLGEDDIIFIEGGEYTLSQNIAIEANDAGVTLRGTTTGPATVINRGDTNNDAYAFELVGLTSQSQDGYGVSFENLTITGGYGAILAARDQGNQRIRVAESIIAANNRYGVNFDDGNTFLELVGNTFFGDQESSQNDDDQGYGVRWYGDDGLAQGNLFYDGGYRAMDMRGDNITIESNVFRNSSHALYYGGDYGLIVGNEFDSNDDAADIRGANTIVSGNVFHDDAGVALELFEASAITTETWGANEFYNNWRAINVSTASLVEGNIIHDNQRGIFTNGFNGSMVRDNHIYNNTGYAIYAQNNANIIGNLVHDNASGIDANGSGGNDYFEGVVAHNLVYDNTNFGIRLNRTHGSHVPEIYNNTIIQPTGDAIRVTSSVSTADVRNNLIVFGGTAINVASGGENNFVSNYNLFHNTGGGLLYSWLGNSFATQADVFYNTGNEGRSTLAAPQFVDAANNDYHLAANSPAIDAGDPNSNFTNEPGPNGERINLGAYGNTDEAATSAAEQLTVADPTELQKYELGGDLEINWQTIGINPLSDADTRYADYVQSFNPVLYYRLNETGGPTVADSSGNGHDATAHNDPIFDAPGAFGAGFDAGLATQIGDQYLSTPDDDAFDLTRQVTMSLWVKIDDASANYTPLMVKGNDGESQQQTFGLYYHEDDERLVLRTADAQGLEGLATANGSFTRGQWHHVAGVIDRDAQQMAIYIDGQRAAYGNVRANDAVTNDEDLIIGQLPGDSYYYQSFEGSIDETALFGQALNDQTIYEQANAHRSEVDIDLVALDGNGQVVDTIQIAENTPDVGTYDWQIPSTGIDLSKNWHIRVTSQQGGNPSDISASVALAASGNDYYINDGSTDNDVYTTAVGDNTNSGKSPDAPMASLAALLDLYDLGEDDTVHIDTGTYDLLGNIEIEAEDSGVTLRGAYDAGDPDNAEIVTLFDRGNRSDGNYVFQLSNADNVTLEHLRLTGAQYGVYVADNSDSDHLTVQDSVIYENKDAGVYVYGDSNDALTVEDSLFYGGKDNGVSNDDQDYGVRVSYADGMSIISSEFRDHAYWGVSLNNIDNYLVEDSILSDNERGGLSISSSDVGVVRGNVAANNADQYNNGQGFDIRSNAGSVVEDNVAHGNAEEGFEIYGATIARDNTAYDNHIGMRMMGRYGEFLNNTVYNNTYGIYAGSSGYGPGRVEGTTAYGNTSVGIWGNDAVELVGNVAYDNNVGMRSAYIVENNLIYSNDSTALALPSNNGDDDRQPIVRNNTIISDGHTAVALDNNVRDVIIENNIFQVTDSVAIHVGQNNTEGFSADFNLFDLQGSATLVSWVGQSFGGLTEWFYATGNGLHSRVGDPQFVDSANDDYHLASGSPGIDAGDPDTAFANEPASNGERVNLGAYGNTAEAALGAVEAVQVIDPLALQKFELGGEMTIDWNTIGIDPLSDRDTRYADNVLGHLPRLYFKLNGQNSGNGEYPVVTDTSAYGHDGELRHDPNEPNNTGTLGNEGAFGPGADSGLSTDGEQQYINVPDADTLDLTHSATMSMWIRPQDDNAEWTPLMVKGRSADSSRAYALNFNRDNYLQLVTADATGEQTLRTADNSISRDVWTHVAGVIDRDAGVMSIYINGQLAASTAIRTDQAVTNGHALRILGSQDSSYYYDSWVGDLDEVALFNQALTAEQIAEQSKAHLSKVDVELLTLDNNGNVTETQTLAQAIPDVESFTWSIPETGLDTSLDYQIRITQHAGGAPSAVSETFSIANAGDDYYINDGSMADDVYTTAIGDDANTGKSADAPMASLNALLDLYDLGPGDTVHMDTGDYAFNQTLQLGANDSGVTIVGAFDPNDVDNPDHVSTLDRGNTSFALIELNNADNVTFEHLTFTGGSQALHMAEDADVGNLIVRDSRFEIDSENNEAIYQGRYNGVMTLVDNVFMGYGRTDHGVDAHSANVTITGNLFEQFAYRAIELTYSDDSVIDANEIRDGNQYGWGLVLNSSDNVVVRNNVLYGNDDGMDIRGDNNLVEGNAVYNNDGVGIQASNTAQLLNNVTYGNSLGIEANHDVGAEGNTVYNNDRGIYATSSDVHISNNVIYGQANYGLALSRNASAFGNVIYNNLIGIRNAAGSNSQFTGQIAYNLIYNNTDTAVDLSYDDGRGRLYHNTIFQEVGDAIRLHSSGQIDLRNNILWTDQGNILYIEGTAIDILASRNVYYRGEDLGNTTVLQTDGGPTYTTLAEWTAADSTQNAGSVEADPGFIDPNGADDVLGTNPQRAADDNFNLAADSPAIDAAASWLGKSTDFLGAPRLDDPGTPNVGTDHFVVDDLGESQFTATGQNEGYSTDDGDYHYDLPDGFAFSFFGESYDRVYVSTNGFIAFDNGSPQPNNSDEGLAARPLIAPLWDDLSTAGNGYDVYTDESVAGQVTIRWQGFNKADGSDVNFSATLFDTGEIQFDYGSGNTNLTPTVGISAGYGNFVYKSNHDGQSNLTNANSIRFAFEPGYADIGALEFAGNSNDTTPPSVTTVVPAQITSGATDESFDEITIDFNEALSAVDARSAASYRLTDRNTNAVIDLLPTYTTGSSQVRLQLIDGDLPEGDYRLELISTADNGLHDLAGQALDGGTYTLDFTVDQTKPTATMAVPPSGQTVYFENGYIDVQFADDGAGLDPASITPDAITITGVSVDAVQDQGSGVYRFVYDQDGQSLPDGEIEIALVDNEVQDLAGNTADGAVLGSFMHATSLDVDVVIQDGSGQRSVVDRILLTFNEPITGLSAQDITLTRMNQLGTVQVQVNNLGDDRQFEITFAGAHTRTGNAGDSLADGRYTLTLNTAAITGQTTGRQLSAGAVTDFHVLFGDIDGNEAVGLMDYLNIRGTYNHSTGDTGYNASYDFNEDGTVNTSDMMELRSRYRKSVDDFVPTTPPADVEVVVNDGDSQRSIVSTVTVRLDRDVASFDAAAFALERTYLADGTADNSSISLNAVQVGARTFELTFTGPSSLVDTDTGSLADGVFQLTVDRNHLFDSGGSSLGSTVETHSFHRVFGDVDGDGDVDTLDYAGIRSTWGRSTGDAGFSNAYDYNGDGTIDAIDLQALRTHLYARYANLASLADEQEEEE